MASLETVQAASSIFIEAPTTSSPRISFSSDFLDENNFISINPNTQSEKKQEIERERARNPDFEFLSSNINVNNTITADELFFEGKLLPFWQIHHSAEKLNKISLSKEDNNEQEGGGGGGVDESNKEETKVSWLIDDDPSPRPPKCTVLWKELLRLKKQRDSSLSPSSSSSSTSSSSSSLADVVTKEEKKEGSAGKRDKHVKRIKKGLERTRSASIRTRPMINVPICTLAKSNSLLPLFPPKKGRLDR